MTIARILAWTGVAALTAACSSTPAYYTERVSGAPPSRAAVVASEPLPDAPARQAVRQPSEASPRAAKRMRSDPAMAASVAREGSEAGNTGTGTADSSSAETRAERERRAQAVHDKRERALKRSLDSICRGC